jgi:hypothetical protein
MSGFSLLSPASRRMECRPRDAGRKSQHHTDQPAHVLTCRHGRLSSRPSAPRRCVPAPTVLTLHGIEFGIFVFAARVPDEGLPAARRSTAPPSPAHLLTCRHGRPTARRRRVPALTVLTLHGIEFGIFVFAASILAEGLPAASRGTAPLSPAHLLTRRHGRPPAPRRSGPAPTVLTLHEIEFGIFIFVARVPAEGLPAASRSTAPPSPRHLLTCRHGRPSSRPSAPCRSRPVPTVLTLHGIETGIFVFAARRPANGVPAASRSTTPPSPPHGLLHRHGRPSGRPSALRRCRPVPTVLTLHGIEAGILIFVGRVLAKGRGVAASLAQDGNRCPFPVACVASRFVRTAQCPPPRCRPARPPESRIG